MKIKLQCFHTSEETLGEAYDMEESILGEFDRMVFRCPECGKEIFVTYEVETPYEAARARTKYKPIDMSKIQT